MQVKQIQLVHPGFYVFKADGPNWLKPLSFVNILHLKVDYFCNSRKGVNGFLFTL